MSSLPAPIPPPSARIPWQGLVLAALLYAAFGAAILHRCVLGGQVPIPSGFLLEQPPFPPELDDGTVDLRAGLGDMPRTFVPWREYAARHLERTGTLPLWKDLAMCGAPLVGNGQSALLYPPNLLAVLLGHPLEAYLYLTLLKLVVGALGVYALARYLGTAFGPALLGGLVFGFGGFQFAFVSHPLSEVGSWLPWLILATDRLLADGRMRWFAAVAALAALQHLAGHPETTFHCQAAVAVFAVVRAVYLRRRIRALPALLRAGLAFVAGAALAAPQILPLLEYIAHSDAIYLRQFESHVSAAVEHPGRSAAFAGALLLGGLAAWRLAQGRRRPALAGGVLLLASAAALYLGVQTGGTPDFMVMLSSHWFGMPWNHDELRITLVSTGILFLGAALPLIALGAVLGRPRVLVAWLAGTFAWGVLLGLRLPLAADPLELLPVFDVAANQRLGFLAPLAGSLLIALGVHEMRAARAADRPVRRFAWLALAPILGAVAAHVALVEHAGIRVPTARGRSAPTGRVEVTWEAWPKPEQLVGAGWVELHGRARAPEPVRVLWLEHRGARREFADFLKPPGTPLGQRWVQEADGRYATAFRFVIRRPLFDELASDPEVRALTFQDSLLSSSFSSAWIDLLERRTTLPRQRGAWLHLALLAAAAALAALLIARRAPAGSAAALLLAPVAASLFQFGSDYLPTVKERLAMPPSPALDYLAARGRDARVLFTENRLPLEVNVWYGAPAVNGYDCLHPAWTARLLRLALDRPGGRTQMQRLPERNDVDLRLLGMAAVRYLVGHPRGQPNLAPVVYPGSDATPFLGMYENPDYLPRARLVEGSIVVPDEAESFAAVTDPTLDLERVVVLSAGTERAPGAGPAGDAEITVAEPDRVVVRVEPQRASHLVLADTWFPGWSARVDGQPRELVRANHAFRAVAVQPGEREVEFRYVSWPFRLGWILAGATLLAMTGAGLLLRRRARALVDHRASSPGT